MWAGVCERENSVWLALNFFYFICCAMLWNILFSISLLDSCFCTISRESASRRDKFNLYRNSFELCSLWASNMPLVSCARFPPRIVCKYSTLQSWVSDFFSIQNPFSGGFLCLCNLFLLWSPRSILTSSARTHLRIIDLCFSCLFVV